MGYELEAFLGSARDLRRWKKVLPATVVCRLAGDLHLVPVTHALERELLAHTGRSHLAEALRDWAVAASHEAVIAHVSGYEFGDQGSDDYAVWSNGEVVLDRCGEHAVADFFRSRVGLDVPQASFDIGRHRGESAAHKWAAGARPEDQIESDPGSAEVAGTCC